MSASAPDGQAVTAAPTTEVTVDPTDAVVAPESSVAVAERDEDTTVAVDDAATVAADPTADAADHVADTAVAAPVADAAPAEATPVAVSEPTPESAAADAQEPLTTGSKPDPRTRDRPKQETPVSTDETTVTFADLELHPELLKALTGLGYEEPTPIQRETIRPLIEGKDVLGQAATGTGKTAAFALPMLHTFGHSSQSKAPRGLVLVPTRELATQVAEAFWSYGKGLGIKVLAVYGGEPIVKQLKTLHRGVDVVVATPGRAKDLIDRGALQLGEIRMVVLDEADEMLDMGFQDDIETILGATPNERQTVLFSATMPSRIDRLARKHQNGAVRIQVARETTPDGEAPKVRQAAYVVARHHKATALCRVLDQEQPKAAIVFCRTRAEVDEVAQTLNGRGYTAEALHGGMDQTQRSRTIDRLKNGSTQLIVATDVAARGLDIDNLTHVVNYDVPSAPEAYVHRIGRVGRAGREGVAITFAQPREHRNLKNIERLTRQQITIAHVPTVADLRAKRLDETKTALRESLAQPGDLTELRAVIDSLSGEFDVADVAAAALKLAHAALSGPVDEEDIPQVAAGRSKEHRGSGFREGSRRDPRGEGGSGNRRERRGSGVGTTRIFVGAGREARMRPQDLVGAIAGESQLSGRDIGAIQINERFSLVEVPDAAADGVIEALRATTIKGRKPKIRREV
ncbi:DEAD/DEAH box helicase [Patulibacter minatonensis]|uniref:DEAD/DEAH box helicase n=1 Tax=Patulibacter minatonensis TaxID=298163 RepID=UPI0012FC3FD1|nr:DEAD/DEAH box helicase [Patulibacter minatonensis]